MGERGEEIKVVGGTHTNVFVIFSGNDYYLNFINSLDLL